MASRPVIGVNLTWLVPGVVGGSEEYTVRLLEAVAPRLGSTVALRLYARPSLIEHHPELARLHQVVPAPELGSKAARIVAEQTWLASVSRRDRIVHHAGGTVPFVRLQPAVVTVHDLQPLEMPEHFSAVKRWWLHHAIPHATRSARLVLCPSRYTARRLRDLLGVPEAKIRVVQHGHQYRQPDPGGLGDADPSRRFGRYLLYPAIAYAHKRHVDAVRALARLEPALDDVNLVFTSRPGPELAAAQAEARRLGLADRVHSLGRVPADELEQLYRSAQALVFPSAYEGFGNPALEAMSAGCPVVASDAGALPEVIGDAGLIVPIGDVDRLATAVATVLTDRSMAADLSARGRLRAERFSTGIAAAQLADVYAELVESRPG